jgi:hypothetical protein
VLPGSSREESDEGVQRWIGGRSFAEATRFDLSAGGEISGLVIEEGGLLLRFEGPGSPLSHGARVVVAEPGGRVVWAQYYPGASWNLLCFPNLPPGVYAVQVSPPADSRGPWRPQWFDRGASLESARTVTLATTGEVLPIIVRLENGGRISCHVPGRVDPGDPRDPEEVWPFVLLTEAAARAVVRYLQVEPEGGDLEFAGLPDGEYKLGITVEYVDLYEPSYGGADHLDPLLPPEATSWYGGGDWDAAEVLTIRDAGEVTGITLEAPPSARAAP